MISSFDGNQVSSDPEENPEITVVDTDNYYKWSLVLGDNLNNISIPMHTRPCFIRRWLAKFITGITWEKIE
jgi:hypothetical protein